MTLGVLAFLATAAIVFSPMSEAFALILGDTGNKSLDDPGWPTGAAAVFNVQPRVAYWEGPPFGGGQWHAECRGDTEAFNKLLERFAKIESKQKKLVVHDGVGKSFWFNPNDEEEKRADAHIDWTFMVWVIDSWKMQQQMQAGLRPPDVTPEGEPVPRIDAYTGGNIDWTRVRIPKGIIVDDQRLEAHGFSVDDGTVIEGQVTDLANGAPLMGEMVLQRIGRQKEGGYTYTNVTTARTDNDGRWVLTSTPEGWHQIVVRAEEYVPRIAGYAQHDGLPAWAQYNTGLVRATTVIGTVKDAQGKPLAEVTVKLRDVMSVDQSSYKSPQDYESTTDVEGRFKVTGVPAGSARVSIHKDGYCRPGLGLEIQIPATDVALQMTKSSRIVVVVDFEDVTRPAEYIVSISPEQGESIGSWGGSGNIDASGSRTFKNVPPGRYVIHGRPNPGNSSQETDQVTVELVGGETTDVELKAKE